MTEAFQLPHSPEFILGAHRLDQLPDDIGVEIAIAGRSNAGKSSAINTLFHRRGLARVSKTPGRTQQINVFSLSAGTRLVDLPGYGYAKVSPGLRDHWARTLPQYLACRQSLVGLLLAMDIRHPLQPNDQEFIAWVAGAGHAVHVLLTKCDKLNRGAQLQALRTVQNWCAGQPAPISAQVFSSLKRLGVDEARDWVVARITAALTPETENLPTASP
jgi:GTP-binding protein